MPAVSIHSRWAGVPAFTDDDGKKAFESYLAYRFTPILGTLFVDVQEGDTLWHVADREYGEGLADLAWVIADFNDILDPFEILEAGRTLKVPPREDVFLQVIGAK